ncbi:hypothetical protein EIP91_004036 [Steccherinum ochraceum]|uniref:Uncharacterized protein n=1 Tax=Steccherinum ochraceum TaxID=92696 RepID=A0A4R0RFS2_9APHY|nr:hypothetical protein EIP91_004036 [Steccherinum ochraceum]
MRFITSAALVALAATAMSAPVDDASQETELYRRFADAVYARGVHDGLHARSSDDRLQRRAPGMDGKPIEVYHPEKGRVPIQNTPGYQPMPPAPPGFDHTITPQPGQAVAPGRRLVTLQVPQRLRGPTGANSGGGQANAGGAPANGGSGGA